MISSDEVVIRGCLEDDMDSITAIYSVYVSRYDCTLELDPPTLDEMKSRRADIIKKNFPYIVACQGADVIGYAYANTFRARPGFNFTVENSIYLKEGMSKKGVGSKLLEELLFQCTTRGLRQMIAVITGGENYAASSALHSRFGFTHSCTLKSVGYKFQRWFDVHMYQKELGDGDRSTLMI